MAAIEKKTKRYPSDLTDEEWLAIEPMLPRPWVVERSFGWLTRYRRLVRDYGRRLDVSEAMIYAAMGSLLVRRLAH